MLLVVDVALLHVEHGIQVVGGDNGVAHPGDVADEVFLTLIDLHIDIDMPVVVGADGVLKDGGIAETQFVVLVDQCLLGFLIALVGEFLRFEHVAELASLVDLSEGALADQGALDLAVLQFLVAVKDQFVHLHLGLLVDIHVEDDLSGVLGIIDLVNLDLRILIAFLIEVSLGQDLGTVDDVTRQAIAPHHTEFCLHILTLRLLDAMIGDGADAGAQTQMDAEVDLGTDDGVSGDADLREQTVAPVTLHGLRNLGAWHIYLLAHRQSGETREHIVLVALNPFHGDTGNLTGTGRTGIGDVGIDNFILSRSD